MKKMTGRFKGTILTDAPMKRYTSMRVGGPVKYLAYPSDTEDIIAMTTFFRDEGIAYRFLGNGTNIIVHDRGLNMALVRITRIRHARYNRTRDGADVEVVGGTSLRTFIRDNASRGLSGLERLYWIPGTVGGAVRMNAGSFGASISDSLKTVTILDTRGNVKTLDRKRSSFGYRTSPVNTSHCVLGVCFSLSTREKTKIMEDMDFVYHERLKRHPMEYPSSGSVFRNTDGEPAWKLIDRAGLRGYRIGGALVSEKHPNFIVNTGNATAKDIKQLIDKIKKSVFETTGITLKQEVELWGFHG